MDNFCICLLILIMLYLLFYNKEAVCTGSGTCDQNMTEETCTGNCTWRPDVPTTTTIPYYYYSPYYYRPLLLLPLLPPHYYYSPYYYYPDPVSNNPMCLNKFVDEVGEYYD